MKNILEFKSHSHFDREIIEREAAEWLVRLDGDKQLTNKEKNDLSAWMARSPAHAQEIKSLNNFSNGFLVLTELNVPPAEYVEKNHFIDGLLLSGRGLALISIFGLAVFFSNVVLFDWLRDSQLDGSNGYYVSEIGEQVSVSLKDGSVVLLNTDSEIRVEYSKDYRDIYLTKGEAHFNVAENKNLPFRVYAGKGIVQATGTAFTIYLYEKDVDVLVTEGEVKIAALSLVSAKVRSQLQTNSTQEEDNKGSIVSNKLAPEILGRLEAGEGATIVNTYINGGINSDVHPRPKLKVMNSENRFRRDTWRHGVVFFAGDRLEDVVKEISRYSPVVIEIVEPDLKNLRVGGQFKVGELDSMLEALEFGFGLNVVTDDTNNIKFIHADTIVTSDNG